MIDYGPYEPGDAVVYVNSWRGAHSRQDAPMSHTRLDAVTGRKVGEVLVRQGEIGRVLDLDMVSDNEGTYGIAVLFEKGIAWVGPKSHLRAWVPNLADREAVLAWLG